MARGMSRAQGQVASRSRIVLRAVRTSRPAMVNRCSRSRLGSARVLAVERQHLRPGEEVLGEQDEVEPELIGRGVVVGQVGQAGVLRAPDPVLDAGPAAVPKLQHRQIIAWCVGGEAGDPVPVGVGQPQLRAGVRPLLADGHPHPGRPSGQVQRLG